MAAIVVALDHKLTAKEMLTWYNDPPVVLPAVLEIRRDYPKYLWSAAELLLSMNGNRAEAAYHLKEFSRLYEAEKK